MKKVIVLLACLLSPVACFPSPVSRHQTPERLDSLYRCIDEAIKHADEYTQNHYFVSLHSD